MSCGGRWLAEFDKRIDFTLPERLLACAEHLTAQLTTQWLRRASYTSSREVCVDWSVSSLAIVIWISQNILYDYASNLLNAVEVFEKGRCNCRGFAASQLSCDMIGGARKTGKFINT
jgi:hypothetical protein